MLVIENVIDQISYSKHTIREEATCTVGEPTDKTRSPSIIFSRSYQNSDAQNNQRLDFV